jgi:ABC-type dipeptide/oligopeptide/nickel transport system ATPase component
MGDGELIEDAKPEELFSHPKDPRTKALIDRYRNEGSVNPEEMLTMRRPQNK